MFTKCKIINKTTEIRHISRKNSNAALKVHKWLNYGSAVLLPLFLSHTNCTSSDIFLPSLGLQSCRILLQNFTSYVTLSKLLLCTCFFIYRSYLRRCLVYMFTKQKLLLLLLPLSSSWQLVSVKHYVKYFDYLI